MKRFLVIAAGNRQPDWVAAGFDEYAKRLRGSYALELVEISLGRRSKRSTPAKALTDEGGRMRKALPPAAHVVALSVTGRPWSTADLAKRLRQWEMQNGPVCLLIGGPDGLAPECEACADETWSLSPLTLPHGLVRIVVAEALYRAWSVLQGHPYHRA